MHLHTNALIVVLALVAGCGSSSKTEPASDASEPAPDAAVPFADVRSDLQADKADATADARMPVDGNVDVARDAAVDAPARDVALDTGPETTIDSFVPGPVEPLVVNSGNTAAYDLAAGAWKVFSFDIIEKHFYCLGVLADGIDAYVGASPSVSPSDYLETTNYMRALNFTAFATGKYYVAVAAKAAASGSFQIADGGDLLEVGDNPVTLTAPDGDNYHFFNFSVAPGHTYAVSVAGDTKNPVTLGLSPLADRSTNGQFAFPLSTRTSALPITDEPIPLESVVKSTSRLYFFYVRVKETANLTITITLAS